MRKFDWLSESSVLRNNAKVFRVDNGCEQCFYCLKPITRGSKVVSEEGKEGRVFFHVNCWNKSHRYEGTK